MLLDAYLRNCLEEWIASGGLLFARSIVLLDVSTRSITRLFQLLDSCYFFGQFRRIVRRILGGVEMGKVYWQA
ncbi:MAG TPA: hypothetical protein VFB60_26500 [Ktedonobacteraceae bacterium]|nr:hypothetical protein [Ktedonobacteraceae bacterium]